jgi:hypothetical protein
MNSSGPTPEATSNVRLVLEYDHQIDAHRLHGWQERRRNRNPPLNAVTTNSSGQSVRPTSAQLLTNDAACGTGERYSRRAKERRSRPAARERGRSSATR